MKFLTSVGLTAFLILSGGVSQAATVVDFEDWTGDPYNVRSRGFSFYGNVSVSADSASNNSTNALHAASAGFKFAPITPGLFTITSLDLQEGLGASDTVTVVLIGGRPSLPNIVQTFTLDGLSNTFETFYPVDFSGLSMVWLDTVNAQGQPSTGGFSVDNIVVPQPGTLCLILFGAALARRRA